MATTDTLRKAFIALEKAEKKIARLETAHREPIAIIGMACRFPGGANNPEKYWDILKNGVDTITEVPDSRWDGAAYYDPDPAVAGKMYTTKGGFLDIPVYDFDAAFFKIAPKEARSLDPQQRLLLEVSWEALENAGLEVTKLEKSHTGVFVGIAGDDYTNAHRHSGNYENINAYALTGTMSSTAAGRISYVYGLEGPCVAIDTSCSSALVALHLAAQSLRLRESKLALVGGVNLILTPELHIGFSKLQALSPDGHCKTFDASANGYVRGEGCAVLILKRLSEALNAGDRILAVVKGSATNQDGKSNGLTAPNGLTQQKVIHAALSNARLSPADISYVEAHGTGTPLGDPIEVEAVGKIFTTGHTSDSPLLMGSVKTNIGHTEPVGGLAGLIKVILSLQHEMIPPNLHFNQPNPHINWAELPVKIPTQLTTWARSAKPRAAGISSFGFSGTNVHVIIAEAPVSPQITKLEKDRATHLLTLSVKHESALIELVTRYVDYLSKNETDEIANICYTANVGRCHFEHRLAVFGKSKAEIKQKLSKNLIDNAEDRVYKSQNRDNLNTNKIAFLFTGQGSQYVGMGAQLYETQPTFRKIIDHCDEILRDYLPRSLLEVLYPSRDAERRGRHSQPPVGNETLNETAYTQPALFALEYALAQLWQSWGIEPTVVMGHSVGEYVAACIAGVFSLEEGLKLIAERARLMQSLPQNGAMISVMANETQVKATIQSYANTVSVAALNGPDSMVLSGNSEAIQAIAAILQSQGIKTKKLQVSHAFHSPLMEPMLAKFAKVTRQITYNAPQIDILSNLTGELATDEIKSSEYWCRHVRQTVKFATSMETLYQRGYTVFLEMGPAPVLLGMGRQCLPDAIGGLWLPSLRPGHEDWQQLLRSLSELYVQGIHIDWSHFDRDYLRHRVELPSYPFQQEYYRLDKPNQPTLHVAKIHPLLDRKISSPLLKEILFETEFNTKNISFLEDHLVYDKVVVSGASHISLILGAAELAFTTKGCVLSEVLFQNALFVPEDGCTVQLVISPVESKANSFKLLSTNKNDPENGTIHVTGNILTQPHLEKSLSASTTFQTIWERCHNHITAAEFYQAQQERHIDLGSSYQWIDSIRQGDMEAICQIRCPKTLIDTKQYQLHPGLIDSSFGLLLACTSEKQVANETFVPFGIEQIDFQQSPNSTAKLWGHCQLRLSANNEDSLIGDIRLFDETGQLIIEFIGFEGRKVNQEKLLAATHKEVWRDWLYDIEWQPQMSLGSSPNYFMPTPVEISTSVRTFITNSIPQIKFYETFLPALESLSASYLLNALSQLGWTWKLSQCFKTAAMAEQLGVVSQHQKLFRRLLEILAEEQIIHLRNDDEWEVIKVPANENATDTTKNIAAQYPAAQFELDLLARCGIKLAKILTGKCDPLQLLFPNNDLTLLTQLYQISPRQQVMNTILQQVVSLAIADLPQGRRIRILEIGAGTGGTTAYLLPHLPLDQTDYTFTDVSPLFTAKAQEKFSDYSFVQYQLLNIEQQPIQQGFGEHEYDIIVAANVLHATQDLSATLQNVQSLLAPGGILILLEGTPRQRWLDLSFGLIEGWWRFTDYNLRPSYPLLSAMQWQTFLQKQGFVAVVSLPSDQADETLVLQQTVIVAQTTKAFSGTTQLTALPKEDKISKQWLIFADNGGIGQQLADHLQADGEKCTLIFSSNADYEKIDEQTVSIDPANPDNFQHLLEIVNSDPSPLKGVIHCWSLDAEGAEITIEALEQAQIKGCGSALHLVQALVKANFSEYPSLWLVSQGAIPVTTQELKIKQMNVAQSPLWGMGKAIALEHPEFDCKEIDLEPNIKKEEAVLILLEEILSKTQEKQIAFRENTRYVARLANYSKLTAHRDQLLFSAENTYLITGGLGDLGLLVAQWMVEKQGIKYLVLISRRNVVTAGVSHQLNILEQAGTQVVVGQADVSNAQQMTQVLNGIEKSMPPLRGIIHAAGILDDGVLTSQTWTGFSKVLVPKVQGAWNLHTLTKHLSLDFFVLFSSAASLLGSQAQANHAAANMFLDALAYYRQAQGLAGLSINWGAWSEIGAAARHQAEKLMAMRGIGTIPPQEGLQIFEHLLSQKSAVQVGSIPIQWPQFLLTPDAASPFFTFFKKANYSTSVDKQDLCFTAQLESVPLKKRRTFLIAQIQSQLASVLGFNQSKPIQIQQGFFEMGMDSLTSVELRNRLQTSLGCSLPSTVLFTHPTIAALIEYLIQDVLASFFEGDKRDADAKSPPQTNNKFAYVDNLNSDELDALINQELESK